MTAGRRGSPPRRLCTGVASRARTLSPPHMPEPQPIRGAKTNPSPLARPRAYSLPSSLDEGAPTGGDREAERTFLKWPISEKIRHRRDVAPAVLPTRKRRPGEPGRRGLAVPDPGRRPPVARRHYDRLCLCEHLKGRARQCPCSGERKRKAGKHHGGRSHERPSTKPGRHSDERPPPLRLAEGRTTGRRRSLGRTRRENDDSRPLIPAKAGIQGRAYSSSASSSR